MTEIHNEIIAACTRNAQSKNNNSNSTITTQNVLRAEKTARLSLQERLAAVTKGKNVRPTISTSSSFSSSTSTHQQKQQRQRNVEDHTGLIQQALDSVSHLENTSEQDTDLYQRSKQLSSMICTKIPLIESPTQLGEKTNIFFHFKLA